MPSPGNKARKMNDTQNGSTEVKLFSFTVNTAYIEISNLQILTVTNK